MSEVTQLDLDGAIDREQYTHAVSHMLAFMEGELTQRHGWCTDRRRYFNSIFPEYDHTKTNYADFELVTQDADYAQLLKDSRARLLWYATDVGGPMIRLDEVNEIFEHGGLPTYGKKNAGTRLVVTLPDLYITVGGDSPVEARDWARYNLHKFIAAAMDGKVDETAPYVVNSVKFEEDEDSSANIEHDSAMIAQADTLRPVSTSKYSSW